MSVLVCCVKQHGETALMIAAKGGYHECVAILTANGADVNRAKTELKGWPIFWKCDEQNGDTALIMAAEKGHHECVSILIANGADVNIANKVI